MAGASVDYRGIIPTNRGAYRLGRRWVLEIHPQDKLSVDVITIDFVIQYLVSKYVFVFIGKADEMIQSLNP